MKKNLNPLRGFLDYTPEQSRWLDLVVTKASKLAQSYGYQRLELPLIEPTQLFAHSLGATTDIVGKEMFTMQTSQQSDSVSLRPEGTVGSLRSALKQDFVRSGIHRVYYEGWMFRKERPQKGRHRQFKQFGIEFYGADSWLSEVEIMLLGSCLLASLGLGSQITLKVNSLAHPPERQAFKDALVTWGQDHLADLHDDAQRQLQSNPLRLLDSKDPHVQTLLKTAPSLADFLTEESKERLSKVVQALHDHSPEGSPIIEVSDRLVRGLDYYDQTVFEWVDHSSENSWAVGGGGRYDQLSSIISDKMVPACGFAMGIERLVMLLEQGKQFKEPAWVMVLISSESQAKAAMKLASTIRETSQDLKVELCLRGTSLKSQLKYADKQGARFVVLSTSTDSEASSLSDENWKIRDMQTGEQVDCSLQSPHQALRLIGLASSS